MARAIALRPDFSPSELRRLAGRNKDAAQSRRLLTRAAAGLGNVTLQIVRDWVVRFTTGPVRGADGVEVRVIFDFGVGAIDWRGAWFNPGT